MRSAILAVALLLAAPGNAARGPLLPGTTLRLGMPLADCEARGGLTPGPAAGDSTLVTRNEDDFKETGIPLINPWK